MWVLLGGEGFCERRWEELGWAAVEGLGDGGRESEEGQERERKIGAVGRQGIAVDGSWDDDGGRAS
jgi:hypothetical protein